VALAVCDNADARDAALAAAALAREADPEPVGPGGDSGERDGDGALIVGLVGSAYPTKYA
jgi:hypothetical protein